MKANTAYIFYTPADPSPWADRFDTAGQVVVRDHGDSIAWQSHAIKVGACFSDVKQDAGDRALARVLLTFNTMVLRDGIDPEVAHRALMAIDEYREAMPPELARQ